MAQQQAQLAFVGCGAHASSCLYPNLPYIAEADLVAVCDLKEELAARNARNFGARKHYTDYRQMLDREALDGVFIVGSPQMQLSIGRDCLKRGLPIFVEKPPAIELDDAAELVHLAREHKTFGMTAFMKRYATAYRLAKQACESPEFGGVRMVDAKFGCGDYPPIWGITDQGLAFLVGNAVHMSDLSQFFAGRAVEVFARCVHVKPGVEGFAASVLFESGAIGSLNLSSLDSWINFQEHLSVSGAGDCVSIDNELELKYYKQKTWATLPDRQVFNLHHGYSIAGAMPARDNQSLVLCGYHGEMQNFVRACLGLEAPQSTLQDGYRALALSRMIWQSAHSGRPEKVPSEI